MRDLFNTDSYLTIQQNEHSNAEKQAQPKRDEHRNNKKKKAQTRLIRNLQAI